MSDAAESGECPAAERRESLRRPAVNTVCRLDSAAGPLAEVAIVWNISTTGVCMLLPEGRPVGAALTGSLETAEGAQARPVVLRVAHCRRLEAGDFALGARFDRPLTEEELKPFVEE